MGQLTGKVLEDAIAAAREGVKDHDIDNTLKPHEHYAYLRTQLGAFLNDYVNREIRIGATVGSARRAIRPETIERWAERNQQYHQELNAFSDHIKALRFLMYQVWCQLPWYSKCWFHVVDFFTGHGFRRDGI